MTARHRPRDSTADRPDGHEHALYVHSEHLDVIEVLVLHLVDTLDGHHERDGLLAEVRHRRGVAAELADRIAEARQRGPGRA